MWLLLFIVFVAVSCSPTYLSVQLFNQPSFFPSFLLSFLPSFLSSFCIHNSYRLSLYSSFPYFDTAIFRSCYSTLVFKGFLSINQ